MRRKRVERRNRWARIVRESVDPLRITLDTANKSRVRPLVLSLRGRWQIGGASLEIKPTWHDLTLNFARGSSIKANGTCIRIGSPDTVLGFDGPGVGSGVEKGATEFYYDSDGEVPSPNKYYFLKDQMQIEYDADSATTRQIGGELVYVVSRDVVEGLCYDRDPVLRTYAPVSSGKSHRPPE